MNNEIQKIRNEFLSQACRYLFGQTANCNGFRQAGMPALQPIPAGNRSQQR